MNTKLIIPIIAGAAVTAALTWLFATEDGAETREKLVGTIKEKYPEVGDQISSLKDKLMDNFSGAKAKAEDVIS